MSRVKGRQRWIERRENGGYPLSLSRSFAPFPVTPRMLYCFCVRPRWVRGTAARERGENVAREREGTLIGYWKSVFL